MKEIQCPFYISTAGRFIYCETPVPDIAQVGLIFGNTEGKDKHMRKYCCGDHALCPYYICNSGMEGE